LIGRCDTCRRLSELFRLPEEQPGWEVGAETSNGREAVEKAKLLRPDVTILDLIMPELNGLEAAREILKTVPTKILILTVYYSDRLIRQTLEAGVQRYVLKSDAGRDLVSAVDALRRNKTFFTAKVAQMVLEGYLGHAAPGLTIQCRSWCATPFVTTSVEA
jgi:DNA-binding NarL/FixJ family response regulator